MIKHGGYYFPYKASFWFMVSVAFWNLFGAGVLGFFINLPFVSYFQHGSFLTAAHGHGALMGVYGMLAIGLALFSLRNIVDPKYWKALDHGRLLGLNIGLMGMIVLTLVPIGIMQALESFNNGFWSARSFDFYRQPVVHLLLWLRMIPDTIFILAGVVQLAAAMVYGLFHMRSLRAFETEVTETRPVVQAPEATAHAYGD